MTRPEHTAATIRDEFAVNAHGWPSEMGCQDCTLVYALAPNKPLETMVRDRARKIARRRMEPIEHSMRLEDQGLPTTDVEARVDAYMRDVDLSKLWDEK